MAGALKRDQVWTRAHCGEVARELASLLCGLDAAGRRTTIDEALRSTGRETPEGALRRVLWLTVAIAEPGRDAGLDPSTDEVEALLRAHRVTPRRSRVSGLWTLLQEARSRALAARGNAWRALWEREVGAVLGGTDSHGLEGILSPLTSKGQEGGFIPPRLEPCDRYTEARLGGRLLELRETLLRDERLGDDVRADGTASRRWQRAATEVALHGGADALVALVRGDDLRHQPALFAKACLLLLAHPSRRHVGLVRGRLGRLRRDGMVYECAALDVVLDGYDNRESLVRRLRELGRVLDARRGCTDPELLLLILAASARLVHRLKQPSLLPLLLRPYERVARQIGDPPSGDPTGVLHPLVDADERRRATRGHASLERAWLTADLVFTLGRERTAQLFRPKRASSRLRLEERERLLRLLAAHGRRLRGPLMKLGQVLSYSIDPSYGAPAELWALQQNALPTPWPAVRSSLEADLGARWDGHFRTICSEPHAVGSVGQVHRAILTDGRAVAVKIRHPGVERDIRRDLSALRPLAAVSELLWPRLDVRALLDEVERMLLTECDFEAEARTQAAFAERFAEHPDLRVPRVLPELCGRQVLVSEFVEGRSLTDCLHELPNALRERLGRAIAELVVGSCSRGWFNTDPHPGNYLVEGERLWVVDFGSVKRWTPERARVWTELIRAGADPDPARTRMVAGGLGMVADRRFDVEEAHRVLVEGCMGVVARGEPAAFRHELIWQELHSLLSPKTPNARFMGINPEFAFGFRVYYGLIAILSTLGPEVDWRREVLRITDTQAFETI